MPKVNILKFILTLLVTLPVTAHEHKYDITDLLVENNVDDITCAAYTLYHESRGEPDIANMMVLATIFNRKTSNHFPDTICGVVRQDSQYSYLFDGKSDVVYDHDVYDHLYRLTEDFIINKDLFIKLSEGIDHYHTLAVNPSWSKSKRMVKIGVFGDHVFYRRE